MWEGGRRRRGERLAVCSSFFGHFRLGEGEDWYRKGAAERRDGNQKKKDGLSILQDGSATDIKGRGEEVGKMKRACEGLYW